MTFVDRTGVREGAMPGNGECAMPDCPRPTRDERHCMCAHHWWLVGRPLRKRYWMAYRAWQYGYGALEVLQSVRQEAIDAVMARSTA